MAVLAQQRQEPIRVTAAGLTIDFQDADLRLVISALAEAGGLNVVYNELPAKRVTLRTTQPIPLTQIPVLLRSLAESNGLTLKDEGSFLRIDAIAGAAPGRPATQTEPQEEARLYVYR